MRSPSRAVGLGAAGLVLLVVLLVVVSAGSGGVSGAFSAKTANVGNELRAAPDFVAPVTSAAVVQKSTGGTPGFVRPGAGFSILAAVTDSGRPASGIAAVSTGRNGGPGGLTLAPGATTTGGVTYTHRSAEQTAANGTAGTYPFSVGAVDVAGNGRTQTGFTYVLDDSAPTGYDVSTTNHAGGIDGRAEAGDSLTLTYSEPIDPISVSSSWDGTSPLDVIAYVANDPNGTGNDYVSVFSGATSLLLPLGTVDLGRNDYTATSRFFGQTGTPSKLAISGNTLTVTFGTASGATTTAGGTSSLRWSVAGTGPTDRAGNPLAEATVAGRGSATRQF